MVWIILSASFVAIFPTWISASSGYTGNVGAYVSDVNGNLVSFSQFGYIEYVVRDGDRIGLIEDYYVTGSFDLTFVNGKAHSIQALYRMGANMRKIWGTVATTHMQLMPVTTSLNRAVICVALSQIVSWLSV